MLLRLFWERSRTEIKIVDDALCYAVFHDVVQMVLPLG